MSAKGQPPHVVALPHLQGAQALLLRAIESDHATTERKFAIVPRDLLLRAAAKLEDVRQLIDPDAGFTVEVADDAD